MSKKDYIEFAILFNKLLKDKTLHTPTVEKVITETAVIFIHDNPKFDWDRFMLAVNKE